MGAKNSSQYKNNTQKSILVQQYKSIRGLKYVIRYNLDKFYNYWNSIRYNNSDDSNSGKEEEMREIEEKEIQK